VMSRYSPPRFGLRQVRAFVCLADELHFGRAANLLFTSQPALSRMIHGLEQALDLKLLARSTRKVMLTPAGEVFASECRLALSHLELAANSAKSTASGMKSRLRMAYMDFAIEGRVPQILESFRTKVPNVSVALEYMPTSTQHLSLLEGRIDLGFMTGEFRAPKVQNVLVEQHEFVALLSEGHRFAARETVCLQDLALEPFVIGGEATFSSFRAMVFDLCHSAGFHPKVVQEVSSSIGIFGLVAAGAGVTIYSGSARSIRRSGLLVKAISNAERKIPIFATCLADHPSAELRRFLQLVIDAQWPVAW
jgi:DNA-binding transcriptional LysR family regulator